jgi:DNA modification methylase
MIEILQGDCLETLKQLADGSVNCCVTSPPYYGLRDYNCAGQAGLESTPDEYIANMVKVFSEVKRVLRDDATLWVNMGIVMLAVGKGEMQTVATRRAESRGLLAEQWKES